MVSTKEECGLEYQVWFRVPEGAVSCKRCDLEYNGGGRATDFGG